MSHPTESHRNHINERILAEWLDVETAKSCALGSCSLANKQAPKFTVRTDVDAMTGHLRILFSLIVTVKAAGRTLKREMFLIIPPHALHPTSALTFESLHASHLDAASNLDLSTFQEAGITDSGRVVRVTFTLATPGIVVMPKTTSNSIKPSTSTSYDLLLGLKSLSKALRFTIYIKFSDYALQGLKMLQDHLLNCCRDTEAVNLRGMYDGRDAVPVDWDRVIYETRKPDLPPPYEGQRELSKQPVNVQVPQSPPLAARSYTSAQDDQVLVAETSMEPDCQSVVSPVLQAVALDDEQVMENILMNIDQELHEMDKVCIELNNEQHVLAHDHIDSDEERYALENAREASLQPRESAPPPTPSMLLSELAEWIRGARTIKPDMHRHRRLFPKLRALGQHARTANVAAFDATRAWCSALLFFDPADVDDDDGVDVRRPAARMLVADMADLVRWTGEVRRSGEMCSAEVRRRFLGLGEVARRAALCGAAGGGGGGDGVRGEYERRKDECIAGVLVVFGQAGTGAGA